MARKFRRSAAMIAMLGALGAAGCGSSRTTAGQARGARVSPSAGTSHTDFSVSFLTPDRTGTRGTLRREDVVSAGIPSGANRGCVTGRAVTAPPAPAGTRLRVELGSGWCPGHYHGMVEELARAACPPGQMCPAFVAIVRRLGRFSFTVKSG